MSSQPPVRVISGSPYNPFPGIYICDDVNTICDNVRPIREGREDGQLQQSATSTPSAEGAKHIRGTVCTGAKVKNRCLAATVCGRVFMFFFVFASSSSSSSWRFFPSFHFVLPRFSSGPLFSINRGLPGAFVFAVFVRTAVASPSNTVSFLPVLDGLDFFFPVNEAVFQT